MKERRSPLGSDAMGSWVEVQTEYEDLRDYLENPPKRFELTEALQGMKADLITQLAEEGWPDADPDRVLRECEVPSDAFFLAEALRSLLKLDDRRTERTIFAQAFKMGESLRELEIRRRPDVLASAATGKKQRRNLSRIREAQNLSAAQAANRRKAEWQAYADDLWLRRPDLSASDAAREVIRVFSPDGDLKLGTVRKALKKPGSAR